MTALTPPWRILIVADFGVGDLAAGQVTPNAPWPEDWKAKAAASLKASGASSTSRVELHFASLEDFSPTRIRGAIAAAADGSAEGVAATALDAALHSPALQKIEAAWRGLAFLLAGMNAGVDGSEPIEIWLLPATRETLGARIRTQVFEAAAKSGQDPDWSAVLIDMEFSHKAGDLALLQDLAGMAKVLQTPFIAGASPGFFDLRYFAHVAALPSALDRLNSTAHQPWRAFQADENARWIALAFGRFLLRKPYITEVGYAESAEEAKPESYLWGSGVWAIGLAIVRSVAKHGHALDLAGSTGGAFSSLPTRSYPHSSGETVDLSTEAPLDDMRALEFVRAGFTPLVGRLRGDVAVIPMTVTVFRMQPGKLTLEATVAYQVTAGRLARFCGRLLDEAPAGDAASRAEAFAQGLRAHLGALAGETEAARAEAVRVTAIAATPGGAGVEATPALLEIAIRCAVPLEGKPLEFGFMLPG